MILDFFSISEKIVIFAEEKQLDTMINDTF